MEIFNIVISGTFNQKIDLLALKSLGEIYTYNPELYHGGYIKLSAGKVTIYKSGKYIIPGIKSIDLIKKLWDELVYVLSIHLDTTLFEKPTIKNMVAKDEMNRELPLERLLMVLSADGAEYEPEVFPGLMWSTEYGSVNIFKNGKLILLGCKTVEDLKTLDEYVKKRINDVLDNQKV